MKRTLSDRTLDESGVGNAAPTRNHGVLNAKVLSGSEGAGVVLGWDFQSSDGQPSVSRPLEDRKSAVLFLDHSIVILGCNQFGLG